MAELDPSAPDSHGSRMRAVVDERDITPFIGVHDTFSAAIASRHFDGLFLSGFGFAASHYGLPDIGFIAWPDMVAHVQRIRAVLPAHMLLVDLDDGYADTEVACHAAQMMESVGASGIVLEDQARPRACGHFEGKRIMPVDDFVEKLEAVLAARRDLFVVARTDTADPADALHRVQRFADAGADAVLVDGLTDLPFLKSIRDAAGIPVAFNQLAGGKSPNCSLSELAELGVSLVNYSTPCLFAAQGAIEEAMEVIKRDDGDLTALMDGGPSLSDCRALLDESLERRKSGRSLRARPASRRTGS